jgi:hypothetical protein
LQPGSLKTLPKAILNFKPITPQQQPTIRTEFVVRKTRMTSILTTQRYKYLRHKNSIFWEMSPENYPFCAAGI